MKQLILALVLVLVLTVAVLAVYANRDYVAFVLAPEGSYMGGAVLDASDAQLELDWEAFQNAPEGAYIGAAVTATPDRIVHAHPNMWPNPEGWPR